MIFIDLYKRGLIPGPTEDETSFFQRVSSSTIKDQVIKQSLFRFTIDWITVVISNKNLLPWEGAALWICDKTPAQIQLRESLMGTKLFLKDPNEFLSHEAIHAARCLFDEPQFEEILAYQASRSSFYKFWGPLFQTPKESVIFVILILLSFIGYWFLPILFFLLPFGFLGYLTFRLFLRHHIFKKCLKKTSYPFILCLTDKEIRAFAKMSQEEILRQVSSQNSPRHFLLTSIMNCFCK